MSTGKSLLLMTVLAAALPAIAQTIPYSYAPRGDTEFGALPSTPAVLSERSRADVRSEYLNARRDGSAIPPGEALQYPELTKYAPDVRAMGAGPAPVRRGYSGSPLGDRDLYMTAP
ncbi:MAG TPA: hypothetical protein VLK85_01340 [Ramlibacter sp.]|nr:hypothetical protein [Ramlibacter sp.]